MGGKRANLSGANLINVDLSGANLSGANLSYANLSGADLEKTIKDNTIKFPIYCKWPHGITDGNLIHIGCEERTVEQWKEFIGGDEVIETPRDTPEFKQIIRVIKAYVAYLED